MDEDKKNRLENAGFKPVFVNEIDPTFAETHYFNNNISVENYYVGDINKLVSEIKLCSSRGNQYSADKISNLPFVDSPLNLSRCKSNGIEYPKG